MNWESKSVSDWVDGLEQSGRVCFTLEQARDALCQKPDALKKSLQRLHGKRRIQRVRQGFYVVVPLQYAKTGIIPTESFLADLMDYLKTPYYLGCLSAAERHGAAHQRIQESQVVVPRHIAMIQTPVLRIRFLCFGEMSLVKTQSLRVYSGDIPVSTPEWTAFDLIRFQKHYGSLDAAATVLTELAEVLTSTRLGQVARLEPCNAVLQRLGWMLDYLEKNKLTEPLYQEVIRRKAGYIRLNGALPEATGVRDARWRIIVNDQPESEL